MFALKFVSQFDRDHKLIFVYVPFHYGCYVPNLVIQKISSLVPEKKMLTHDEGQQPIAIGHLSDLGNLKSDFSIEIHFISKEKLSIYNSN